MYDGVYKHLAISPEAALRYYEGRQQDLTVTKLQGYSTRLKS